MCSGLSSVPGKIGQNQTVQAPRDWKSRHYEAAKVLRGWTTQSLEMRKRERERLLEAMLHSHLLLIKSIEKQHVSIWKLPQNLVACGVILWSPGAVPCFMRILQLLPLMLGNQNSEVRFFGRVPKILRQFHPMFIQFSPIVSRLFCC